MRRISVSMAVFVFLLAACGPSAAPRSSGGTAGDTRDSKAPKRVATAILGETPALVQRLNAFGQRGTDAVEDLVLAGLTVTNNTGVLRPRLGEAVPGVENGMWQVLDDGRMVTTWRIMPGARWHDGMPLTAHDLAFAARVGTEVPEFGDVAFASVERVEVVDEATIRTHWHRPYIEADRMFGQRTFASPLPRHLLEQSYVENRATFTQLPYWNTDFVGTGPFKLKEFAPGSHLVFEAFDGYAPGRPKIDIVEVRFFTEPKAMLASILAGSLDLTLGKTLSVEEAQQILDQGRDVRIEYTSSNAISVYPQMLTPNPPIIGNVVFRRALLHAIDRQELADTLLLGRGTVAHSYMFPNQAQYREIEARLPRYEHDPRRTAQLLEGLGYTKGSDGLYRDGTGSVLEVEIRASTTDINQKAMISIADTWQRNGVRTSPHVYSRQAAQDNEFMFTYPGFFLQRYTSDLDGLKNLHSSRIPLPENNFRSGNTARYSNPELDAMLDRYFSTVQYAPRLHALGQIIYHVADQVTQLSLFYDAEPTVIGSRLGNVTARWPTSTQAWNAHEWDVVHQER